MSAGCSEVAAVVSQGPYEGLNWERSNCPHLQTGLVGLNTLYPSLSAGANVVIPSGSVLVRPCDLPAGPSPVVLNRITVKSGASLIFDDQDMEVHVREIYVEAGAALRMGSATCRLYSKIKITFHGSRADSSHTTTPTGQTSKGLLCDGVCDVHGKRYHPTWTRLAVTAQPGASFVFLQDNVNWEVGQQVVIITSVFHDCPDEYKDEYCKPCENWRTCSGSRHQNEIRTITALHLDPASSLYVLQLDAPLAHKHYAGREYQTEVALLSRRIVFEGSDSGNDAFGAHVMIMGRQAEGRMSGVQSINGGQKNIVARYPFHFHLMGDSARTAASYFQDCTVLNSHFRAFVVHGTNATRVSRNVAFNVYGFAYYLEDGVEERNLLEYNLAAHVHPIKKPANGGWGQEGEQFQAAADLFLPADSTASGFYALNAHNSFIGNAASGGWSGFAFPNAPQPMEQYKGLLPADSPYNPYRRPLLRFYGNTAHSTGFYWIEHGTAIYVGAWLDYAPGGGMRYSSGRHERNTVNPDGTTAWMVFEDTKIWLANKGISHWGNTAVIRNAEMHDVRVSAMLFGEAAIHNALVTGRTPNHPTGYSRLADNKMGFQFYDTWVKTILTDVTFRNFSRQLGYGDKDYAIRYMDHSDHYTPQGINSVIRLRFEDVAPEARLGIANCGAPCGGGHTTMSSKIYSVWDWDGSLTQTGKPTILGSSPDWWNWGSSCTFRSEMKVWTCDWAPRTTVVYIEPYVAGLMDGCDYARESQCTDQYAPYTVGTVSQWGGAVGASRKLDMSPWPGVSGLSNTGWYWRPKADHFGVDGAPASFRIADSIQMPRGHFVVLAVKYPPSAQFRVHIESSWWGKVYADIPMASSLAVVTTPREDLLPPNQFVCTGQWFDFCQNTGGVGPAWYFDGNYLYLRVVPLHCYNLNTKDACPNRYYQSEDVKVWSIMNGFRYHVDVTSCAGCTVQSTHAGVTYYATGPSDPPSAAFATDWGTAQPHPDGIPTPRPPFAFTCPPPQGQGAVPSKVSVPGVSNLASSSLSLSWTAPSDGGLPISRYIISRRTGQAGTFAEAKSVDAPATSTSISGLTPDTLYGFTVAAVNSLGAGPASDPVAATTLPANVDVDGGWGDWSACSKQCGSGTQTRACDSPAPAGNGRACQGVSMQFCNTHACTVDGGWAEWGACSAACGGGIRTRTCSFPPPSGGGADCPGASTEPCSTQPCTEPIDGGWSHWSSCSAPCGQGVKMRTCTEPPPANNGAECVGDSSLPCNDQPCNGLLWVLRLALNYEAVYSSAALKAQFETSFSSDVAAALGIAPSQIAVFKILPLGDVTDVYFYLTPSSSSSSSSSDGSAADLSNQLTQHVNTPSSTLYQGVVTRHTQQQGSAPLTNDDGDEGEGFPLWVIGAILGALLIAAAAYALWRRRGRAALKTTSGHVPSTTTSSPAALEMHSAAPVAARNPPVPRPAHKSPWAKHFDGTHKAYYWYNSATGESSWEKPEGAAE